MGRHSTTEDQRITDTRAAGLRYALDTLPRKIIAALLAAAGVATLVGVILLWPPNTPARVNEGFRETQLAAAESVTGTVTEHTTQACGSPSASRPFDGAPIAPPQRPTPPGAAPAPECHASTVQITSGPDEGKNTLIETSGMPGDPELSQGEKILLAIRTAADGTSSYSFLDIDRSTTLWIWVGVIVLLIVAVGALRGALSLVGLAFTLLVVLGFLVPGLLHGHSPMWLAIVAGSAILFPVIFLVHGVNWKSGAALAGTLSSMVLAAAASQLAIATSGLRGLGDDDNLLIQLYLPDVSVTGLLLAGFIIGALGVLNDVTIAQASTVQELFDAAPDSPKLSIFRSAMRVGRDHIASMVYTLVLAYVGTALPMSLVLSVADRPFSQVFTSDVVASEILRSGIGAIALVLAVPITTLFAVYTVRARS